MYSPGEYYVNIEWKLSLSVRLDPDDVMQYFLMVCLLQPYI